MLEDTSFKYNEILMLLRMLKKCENAAFTLFITGQYHNGGRIFNMQKKNLIARIRIYIMVV